MAQTTPEHIARKPPQFLNQLVSLILRSPLHSPISKTLMLLTFKGRKSRKPYTIPIAYAWQDDTIMVFTDHNWWKNFREKAPVTVRVQGKKRTGTAEAILDKEVIAKEMLIFVGQHPRGARAYEVTLDAAGQPDAESVRKAALHFTLVRISLDQGQRI